MVQVQCGAGTVGYIMVRCSVIQVQWGTVSYRGSVVGWYRYGLVQCGKGVVWCSVVQVWCDTGAVWYSVVQIWYRCGVVQCGTDVVWYSVGQV